MELGSCAAQVVGADLEAKMEALHALGYDFIEPAWRGEVMAQLGEKYGGELRRLGERTGCPVKSAIFGVFSDMGTRLGTPESRAAEMEQVTRACETIAAAGGDVLLLNNWAGQEEPDYDTLYTNFLRAAGEVAAPYGVKLAVEHIPGSKYRNTAAKVFELVQMVDLPNVGVYYDIANNLYINEDPIECARAVAPKVIQYHVKGFRERGLETMPLREVKAIFESAGFQGRVATEIDSNEEAGKKTNAHLAAAMETLKRNGYK